MGKVRWDTVNEVAHAMAVSGLSESVMILPDRGRGLGWLNERSLPALLERCGLEEAKWALVRERHGQGQESATLFLACERVDIWRVIRRLNHQHLCEARGLHLDAHEVGLRSHVAHWEIQAMQPGTCIWLWWSDGVEGLKGLAMKYAILTAASEGRLQGVGQA